jgi:hypothetical protein
MKLRKTVGALGIALVSAAVVPAYADGRGDGRGDHRRFDRGGETRVQVYRDRDRDVRRSARRVVVERPGVVDRQRVRVVEG